MGRTRLRTRLAVGITSSTLAIVLLVGAATAALAEWRADDPVADAQIGAAQVNGVPVVVVTEATGDDVAGGARSAVLGWMLVALGVSIVPSVAVGWFVSARLMRPLDDAMANAEAAERDRRRRLDEVIHELRTPLAVAGTNLELAADDATLDDDTRHLIDAARRAADRMRRTVDDLAEHGSLQVSTKDGLDLAAECRAVVAEHTGPARARSLHLRADGAHRLPVPEGDRAAVRTVLGNLTSNAVRLAPGGSTITVSCGAADDWAWAAVTDEGPGIATRDHAHVFERGWRGRHDRHRDRGGEQRGLGLTITRQLVEAHGGVVTIESEEGLGTTFAIWLPLSAAASDHDVIDDDRLHPATRPWAAPVDATAGV